MNLDQECHDYIHRDGKTYPLWIISFSRQDLLDWNETTGNKTKALSLGGENTTVPLHPRRLSLLPDILFTLRF